MEVIEKHIGDPIEVLLTFRGENVQTIECRIEYSDNIISYDRVDIISGAFPHVNASLVEAGLVQITANKQGGVVTETEDSPICVYHFTAIDIGECTMKFVKSIMVDVLGNEIPDVEAIDADNLNVVRKVVYQFKLIVK